MDGDTPKENNKNTNSFYDTWSRTLAEGGFQTHRSGSPMRRAIRNPSWTAGNPVAEHVGNLVSQAIGAKADKPVV